MLASAIERVKWLRTVVGLSAAAFGVGAGLSRATIASLESGRNDEPDLTTLRKISEFTGVPLAWLLDGDGKPPSERAVRSKVLGKAA